VFQYADDIAVTYQAKTFDECENNLEADIEVLNQFLHRWCLQPIKHVDHPKYLGVTLDRTLTFKFHLEKAAK
jgi:hypothetical protein